MDRTMKGLRLLILLSAVPFLLACLDVAVSPGTPLEWLSEYPFHGPQPDRGSVPILTGPRRRDPKEHGHGRTMVVPRRTAEESFVVPQVQDAMSFARIITVDVTNHLEWVNPLPGGADSRRWSQASKHGLKLTYPPPQTLDSHWFAMGVVLRHLLHPQRMSDRETKAMLVRLGPQALRPLSQIGVAGATATLVKLALTSIPRIPARPPSLRASNEDPFLAMAERLAIAELAASFGYGLEAPFAPRCRSLGEEGARAFCKLVTHSHSLVRENAVLLLSGFQSDHVRDTLLQVAARSPDPVCRQRAIYALGNFKSPEVIKTLTALLGKKSATAPALQALGKIGGEDAAKAIYQKIRNSSNLDILFTGIPALGRCGVRNEPYRVFLKRLRTYLKKNPPQFPRPHPVSPNRPDQPDAPDCKAQIVIQLITLALARLGDDDARTAVLDLAARAVQGRQRGRIAQDPISPVLGPCTYYFLDSLAELGADGARSLEGIFRRAGGDRYVRMRAIWQYARCWGARAAALTKFLATVSDPVLRAAVLQAVARLDRDEGRRQALAAIADFAALGPWPRGTRGMDLGVDVVVALQIAGGTGGADYRLLAACLQTAKHLKTLKPARKPQPRQPKRRGPPPPVKHEIAVVPDLIPHILLELGRTRDRRALPILTAHLGDRAGDGRAEAALALGSIAGREGAQALVKTLIDADGWVRYCSFRGLQAMRTGHPFEDWIFAAKSEMRKWHGDWTAWADGYRGRHRPQPEIVTQRPDTPDAPPPTDQKPDETEPPKAANRDVAALVAELIAAAEAEDRVAIQLLQSEIAERGTEAVPSLLATFERPYLPVVIFDILEAIAKEPVGFDVRAWDRWWKQNLQKWTEG